MRASQLAVHAACLARGERASARAGRVLVRTRGQSPARRYRVRTRQHRTRRKPAAGLRHVTETATSTSKVWVAAVERQRAEAARAGATAAARAKRAVGRGIAVRRRRRTPNAVPRSGSTRRRAVRSPTTSASKRPPRTPLAWSPDSRYLAVERQSNGTTNFAAGSGLDVIDTQTGTVTHDRRGRDLRRELRARRQRPVGVRAVALGIVLGAGQPVHERSKRRGPASPHERRTQPQPRVGADVHRV